MRALLSVRCGAAAALAVAVLVAAAGCDGSSPAHHRSSAATPSRRSAAPSPSLRSAAPSPPRPHWPSVASVLRPTARGGMVLERSIPSSGAFRPRPAFLYVPPVLRGPDHRHVPVLEILHGTPGGPADWFTRGQLRATADAFAARHGGLAPLVVAPDLNGTRTGDSECIRTAAGADVETYLTVDVVRWVRRAYARDVGVSKWWVAGLSEGGLCATVLALRHPHLYAAFGDLSGLLRPVVDHLSPAASDQQLYAGSVTARLEHDPLWLMRHRRFTGLRGWFVCGASDAKVVPAQSALVAAARRARLPTHAQVRPGRHAWTVWAPALRDLLPWLWSSRPA